MTAVSVFGKLPAHLVAAYGAVVEHIVLHPDEVLIFILGLIVHYACKDPSRPCR